jgi:molybdopterin converting factor small subunit
MPAAAPAAVTVRLLLFASYAEALGTESLSLTLGGRATVADAVARLRQLPGGDRLPPKPLCARNLAHAGLTDPLTDGDELAILPPMAGG